MYEVRRGNNCLWPQLGDKQCSLSKVTMVGLGVILILGGAFAAGFFYPQLGHASLGSLGAVPLGLSFILLSLRSGAVSVVSSQTRLQIETHQEKQPIEPPKKDADKRASAQKVDPRSAINNLPWDKLSLWVNVMDKLFPLAPEAKPETQARLRALNKESLAIIGKKFDVDHMVLLNNEQLNDLPWESLIDLIGSDAIEALFPLTRDKLKETKAKLHVLREPLKILWQGLGEERLALLESSQLKYLPWDELRVNNWKEVEKLLSAIFPLDERDNVQKTGVKLRALDKESLEVIGKCLEIDHLVLLDKTQLNHISWDYLVKTREIGKDLIATLFPIGTESEKRKTGEKLRALDKNSLAILGAGLGLSRLQLLDKGQLKDLPWEKLKLLKEFPDIVTALFPVKTHSDKRETGEKLRTFDQASWQTLLSGNWFALDEVNEMLTVRP